jgi:hypothetical protein
MRLRQIALVARELDPVVADLCAVLGLEVCFRDPGVAEFGLRNALMPIDTCFLEVVSPLRPDTTAGRLLDKRGGDGGYMVIVQTDDLARDRRRLAALGVRIVWQIELPDAQTIHLHPRDVGAAILSLDQMPEPESWRWGGPSWRSFVKTDVTRALVGAELQSHQPAALAARWGQILGHEPKPGPDGAHALPLDPGVLRFVPLRDDRGEGVSGIDVRVADPAEVVTRARRRGARVDGDVVVLSGTRIRLLA